MNPLRSSGGRTALSGFTIIELLVVVAIIATLISLLVPVTGKVLDQVRETACTQNLRQLGMIIHTVAIENNSTYPSIENDPQDAIHLNAQGKVWTLPELVTANGATTGILKCPADVSSKLFHPAQGGAAMSYFDGKGSSYEWFPFFEGVNINTPQITTPFGAWPVPTSRVRLLMDYAENGEAPHSRSAAGSTMHVFYADGSVRTVVLSRTQ